MSYLKYFYKKYISNLFFNIFKNIFFVILAFQFMMFIISGFYSIFINAYVFYDYDKGMNKTAYNYFNSKKIEKFAQKPVYNQVLGTTNLFFNSPSISDHEFNKCFYYTKNIDGNKYKYCVEKLDIKTIIVNKDKLINNKFFTCKRRFLKRVSRNIFLEEKLDVDFCDINHKN